MTQSNRTRSDYGWVKKFEAIKMKTNLHSPGFKQLRLSGRLSCTLATNFFGSVTVRCSNAGNVDKPRTTSPTQRLRGSMVEWTTRDIYARELCEWSESLQMRTQWIGIYPKRPIQQLLGDGATGRAHRRPPNQWEKYKVQSLCGMYRNPPRQFPSRSETVRVLQHGPIAAQLAALEVSMTWGTAHAAVQESRGTLRSRQFRRCHPKRSAAASTTSLWTTPRPVADPTMSSAYPALSVRILSIRPWWLSFARRFSLFLVHCLFLL